MVKAEVVDYVGKLVKLTYMTNGYQNVNCGRVLFVGRRSVFFDRADEFEGLIKTRDIKNIELIEEIVPL